MTKLSMKPCIHVALLDGNNDNNYGNGDNECQQQGLVRERMINIRDWLLCMFSRLIYNWSMTNLDNPELRALSATTILSIIDL